MSLNLRAIISVPSCVFCIFIHRSASRFHHFQLQDSRQHLPLPQMLPLRTCPSSTPMLPHQVPHKTRWSSHSERGCNRNTRDLLVSLPAFSHSDTLIESCKVPRAALRKRRDFILFFFHNCAPLKGTCIVSTSPPSVGARDGVMLGSEKQKWAMAVFCCFFFSWRSSTDAEVRAAVVERFSLWSCHFFHFFFSKTF